MKELVDKICKAISNRLVGYCLCGHGESCHFCDGTADDVLKAATDRVKELLKDELIDPQPIETAPKDGTVILTDKGTAKYFDAGEGTRYCRLTKWWLCVVGDTEGISEEFVNISPTCWIPMPRLVLKK